MQSKIASFDRQSIIRTDLCYGLCKVLTIKQKSCQVFANQPCKAKLPVFNHHLQSDGLITNLGNHQSKLIQEKSDFTVCLKGDKIISPPKIIVRHSSRNTLRYRMKKHIRFEGGDSTLTAEQQIFDKFIQNLCSNLLK